jgi:hypothetical protein
MHFRQHATPTIEGMNKSYHRPPLIHPKHERHKLIWVALLLVAKPISINTFFFPCHGRLTTNRIVFNTNPNLLIQSHKTSHAIADATTKQLDAKEHTKFRHRHSNHNTKDTHKTENPLRFLHNHYLENDHNSPANGPRNTTPAIPDPNLDQEENMEWTLSEEQQFLDSLPQSQRLFCGPDNLDEEEAAVYEPNPDRQALEAIVRSWNK